MADTNWRGPVNAMGSLEIESGTSATIEPMDGPSVLYQGIAIPDIRAAAFASMTFRPGQMPATLSLMDFYAVDNIPQTATTTLLAAAQVVTAGLAVALVTAQPAGASAGVPSIAIDVPILVAGTTIATTANIALDFGFATGTTTANSSAVVVNDNTQFTLGQWIVIGGAANAAGSLSLSAQVVAIATANVTGINVSPSPATGIANAPIGAGNLFGGQFLPPGTQFGPATASAAAHSPRLVAGFSRVMNPREMIARNVSLTVGTTAATTAFLVTGWDVWDAPMSEQITVPSANRAASTIFGKKAFKYISSIVPTTSIASTFSFGIGDVFGVPFVASEWEQTQSFWNGCAVPTSLGFTAGATTGPATNTTGDIRGTLQVSTNGTGSAAAVATAQVSNNSARLAIIQSLGVWNQIAGTPLNTAPVFGIAQSTT